MQIQESGEMYLETILVLSKEKDKVRSIDVSEYMNVSKPAVSRAVGILKQREYIITDNDGYLFLTDQGIRIAENIYEKHCMLSDLLIRLGVDEKTATSDACKMEHVISDETFEAIKKHSISHIK